MGIENIDTLRSDVLRDLKEIAAIIGHTPTYREYTILSREFDGHYACKLFCSWNKALLAAGLQPNMVRVQTLNKSSLINKLKELAGVLGRTPTIDDINGLEGFPSQKQFYRVFGSWTSALMAADLNLNRWGKAVGNRREIILEWIKAFYKDHGYLPSVHDLQRKKNAPSYHVVLQLFGSFNKAFIECGFEPRPQGRNQLWDRLKRQ
jgi:hypothetical protein